MKILRLSVMALAAAAGCVAGCQSSGCGGTNINQNSNTPAISCGPGTVQSGGVCVIPQNVNSK
jgi:hypothetical protein